MCGKYMCKLLDYGLELGSPPHVREIQRKTPRKDVSERITPACAGNTGTIQGVTIEGEDHPRMCGKYCVVPNLC